MSQDDRSSSAATARVLVGMLRERGDEVDVPRPVTFELWWPTPVPPAAAVAEARAAGYTVVRSGPAQWRWLRRVLPRGGSRLALQSVTAVDEASAVDFTRTLESLALRHGGRFEQWLPEPVGQD